MVYSFSFHLLQQCRFVCCGAVTSQLRNRSHKFQIQFEFNVPVLFSGPKKSLWVRMICACPFGSGGWELFPLKEDPSTNYTKWILQRQDSILERKERVCSLRLKKGIIQFCLQRPWGDCTVPDNPLQIYNHRLEVTLFPTDFLHEILGAASGDV